jgi:hypothetical protein
MKDSKHDELLCEKWKVKKKERYKKRKKKCFKYVVIYLIVRIKGKQGLTHTIWHSSVRPQSCEAY